MQSTFVRSLVFPLLLALLLVILGPTPVARAAVNLNVDRFDDPAVTKPEVGAAACTPALMPLPPRVCVPLARTSSR